MPVPGGIRFAKGERSQMLDTTFRTIELELRDGIATLTLANPDKRNALSLLALNELCAAIDSIGAETAVKVVILRALGPAFSAGHDLRELQRASRNQDYVLARDIFVACVRVMSAMQSIAQPVIAEVTGVATAAGCQLVATCDLAFADLEATFATPGVKIGLFCTTPMVALTRSIGRKRALQMLLTGDPIDARTAADWGLINAAFPADRLRAEVSAVAQEIAAASAYTVGLGKAAFYAQIELPQPEAYEYAQDIMVGNALDVDALEGIGAFLERRPAEWHDGETRNPVDDESAAFTPARTLRWT
jgi:enoyl-CoA hydratase/carnithine racemase